MPRPVLVGVDPDHTPDMWRVGVQCKTCLEVCHMSWLVWLVDSDDVRMTPLEAFRVLHRSMGHECNDPNVGR